jgi:hypothetical protein
MASSFVFHPRRTWLVPASLLLPKKVEFRGEMTACVVGDLQSGKVRGCRRC